MRLVLASASPRRRELLASIGLELVVRPSNLDEARIAADLEPAEAALAVARAKAAAVREPSLVVLAADTVVVVDGDVLGKPADRSEARAMLERLRGRSHEVVTALCIRTATSERAAVRHTDVRMRAYAEAEVEAYVEAGHGLDKAGGYGIQDDQFRPVESVAGCWCNVMGLPLWTAYRRLAATGCVAPLSPDVVHARCAACPLRNVRRG